jgi:NAD(P)-dependent dehydrogenase (short-subunit alcohol dehydrogenase family)
MGFKFDTKHRTAIFGAGGGIGSSCVTAFTEAGAEIAALDLTEDLAARSIAGLGAGHQSYAADVTDPVALSELAAKVCADEPVDSVIYCSGITSTSDVADEDWSDYRKLMSVNLDGAFYATQAFCRPMLAAKAPGSFVYISSMSGQRGEAQASAYCASKFGLIGMVESFAAENTATGIRANAVAPGNVDTAMLQQVAREIAVEKDSTEQEIWDWLAQQGSANRLVQPSEVAQTCLWLASPLASGITGAVIKVDVGQTLDW